MDDCSFGVTGLRLQGAKCNNNRLSLTATIVNELPLTCLKWVRVNPSDMYKKSVGKVKEERGEKGNSKSMWRDRGRRKIKREIDSGFERRGRG